MYIVRNNVGEETVRKYNKKRYGLYVRVTTIHPTKIRSHTYNASIGSDTAINNELLVGPHEKVRGERPRKKFI